MATTNAKGATAPSTELKAGKYIFQLTQKIIPQTPDQPPYQRKKGLPGKIQVFDEKTESLRMVRVVPGSTSYWVDEQLEKKIDDKRADENAWSPEFILGVLELNYPQDRMKIERMMLDDRYDGKKVKAESGRPNLYTMIDENANAVKNIDQMRLLREAENLAWAAIEKNFDAIEGHAKFLGIKYLDGTRPKTQEEITVEYVNKAKEKPELFKKTINSPVVKMKAEIQAAIDGAAIDLGNVRGEACWGDTKAFICKIDLTREPVESLIEFASSGKAGDQFIATVKELIKK